MALARRAVKDSLPAYGRVMEVLRRFQPGVADAIETYVKALRTEAAESRARARDLQQQIDEQAEAIRHLRTAITAGNGRRPTPLHSQQHTQAAHAASQTPPIRATAPIARP